MQETKQDAILGWHFQDTRTIFLSGLTLLKLSPVRRNSTCCLVRSARPVVACAPQVVGCAGCLATRAFCRDDIWAFMGFFDVGCARLWQSLFFKWTMQQHPRTARPNGLVAQLSPHKDDKETRVRQRGYHRRKW
jgi:hypothetical protein